MKIVKYTPPWLKNAHRPRMPRPRRGRGGGPLALIVMMMHQQTMELFGSLFAELQASSQRQERLMDHFVNNQQSRPGLGWNGPGLLTRAYYAIHGVSSLARFLYSAFIFLLCAWVLHGLISEGPPPPPPPPPPDQTATAGTIITAHDVRAAKRRAEMQMLQVQSLGRRWPYGPLSIDRNRLDTWAEELNAGCSRGRQEEIASEIALFNRRMDDNNMALGNLMRRFP